LPLDSGPTAANSTFEMVKPWPHVEYRSYKDKLCAKNLGLLCTEFGGGYGVEGLQAYVGAYAFQNTLVSAIFSGIFFSMAMRCRAFRSKKGD